MLTLKAIDSYYSSDDQINIVNFKWDENAQIVT